jgi:hypothetical protein
MASIVGWSGVLGPALLGSGIQLVYSRDPSANDERREVRCPRPHRPRTTTRTRRPVPDQDLRRPRTHRRCVGLGTGSVA